MKDVTIYTDGACSGNPGPGGWGAVLLYEDIKRELYGGKEHTTNNQMELCAAIQALHALKEPCRVALYSDSTYLIHAFQQGWLRNWVRRNWIKSDGKPVENRELWEELLRLSQVHSITWNKVKGHATNPWNNRCDELARGGIAVIRGQKDS